MNVMQPGPGTAMYYLCHARLLLLAPLACVLEHAIHSSRQAKSGCVGQGGYGTDKTCKGCC